MIETFRSIIRAIASLLLNELAVLIVTISEFASPFKTKSKGRLLYLHFQILKELWNQFFFYPHYRYSWNFPYQGLKLLHIVGDRDTEERFEELQLANLLTRDSTLLDIGCNCGFMALYTSFRTQCSADGVDINPYMINIGNHVASHLGVDKKVRLFAKRFQDFNPDRKYSVIFSFATHWTDDGNYRLALKDHLMRTHSLLDDHGILILESHCADLNNPDFSPTIQSLSTHFEEFKKFCVDQNRRLVVVLRKRAE